MVVERLKILSTTTSYSSTTTTISLANPRTSQTITIEEPSSSSPFLENEKQILQLNAKLLSKQTVSNLAVKSVSSDICDPFFAEYRKITELTY